MTLGAEDRRDSFWNGEDYQKFVAALRTSMSDQEIADHLGRSLTAIRARAKLLLLDAWGETMALRKLRQMAASPDFDWEQMARTAHTQQGIPYWDAAADEQLIHAWAANPPPSMDELVATLGISERDIAKRCLWLDLAQTRIEVVDRFGAKPGGVLDKQTRLAKDTASTAVGILVITSETGAVVHLSLHPDIAAAAAACTELRAEELSDEPGALAIATRVVGEGSVRRTLTGAWADRHTIDLAAAPKPAPGTSLSRWRWLRRQRRR
ncbi:hypothetical protein F5X71_08460 [Nocardia brasiliensis]|uniref:Uncharacterized protein n=1 Tax=Nocardia brasiliensis TaxID=37326 RepID=A0A6G9XN30_NOCBR|nr:hypothetical protein [Nocardia brasiliensis]QIS02351.1 hypothetical protein F5X71_08460 [Nocardia brasiliensis]